MTTFQNFYENVRVGDAQPIRNEVEKLVSQVTFLNWRRGTYEPAAQFWGEINHIAEKFGYEKPYKVSSLKSWRANHGQRCKHHY